MNVGRLLLREGMLEELLILRHYCCARSLRLTNHTTCIIQQRRHIASQKHSQIDKQNPSKATQKADVAKHGEYKSVLEQVLLKPPKKAETMAEKVKEKAENTFFYAVLVASIGALGVLCYFLLEQFFSSDSPQKIYSNALSMIRADDNCEQLFGNPIAGFGEETSRGRRRHVAHLKYQKDGRERIRVVFHLKGPRCEGIAQAEMELLDGNWEWRFLLVQTNERPSRTHVLIDNRV